MNKRTQYTRYTKETAEKVRERDNFSCLFCRMGYHTQGKNLSNLEFNIFDIAHYINRSQGGLGIEENLILLCRYHHHLLDNGSKGLREEMLTFIEKYLKFTYPNWNKEDLVYKKWRKL